MNKKGFILSTYVYILLTFFLLILGTTLVVLNNTKILAKKIKEESFDKGGINSEISLVLKGNKEIELNQGGIFIDPGYTAQTKSGESLKATINSNVDTSKAGDYIIIYTVIYNGQTKSVTRNVKVIESESIFLLNAKLIAEKAELKYIELGNASNITCESVEVLDVEDYQKCSIIFDEDKAKVNIVGRGKFEGLDVCDATKEEAIIDNGHSACKLNSDYQEVEYLESTGTQWIDTEFKSNQNTKVIISAKVLENNHFSLFGSRTNTLINTYVISTSTGNNLYTGYNNENFSSSYILDTNRHEFEKDKNNTFVDRVLIRTAAYSEFETEYNAYLFSMNHAGAADYYAGKFRIYYTKIYNSDILVRDYIPVYRKSDNVIGLYDLVNDVFYTNSGTGTFLKGNNIVR